MVNQLTASLGISCFVAVSDALAVPFASAIKDLPPEWVHGLKLCARTRGSVIGIDPTWNDVGCQSAALAKHQKGPVANALIGTLPGDIHHHPTFELLKPFSGNYTEDDDILVDFLGVRTPAELYCTPTYRRQFFAHALRFRQCNLHDIMVLLKKESPQRRVQMRWPVVAEEYFEYVTILRAVRDYISDVVGSEANCFREYDNFCVDANGQDLPQEAIEIMRSDQSMCEKLCSHRPSCSAYEWFSSGWNGYQCYHILSSIPASMGSSGGYKHLDARCFVKQSASSGFCKPLRPFSFVELGAGYGHWTFAAHRLLQQFAELFFGSRRAISTIPHAYLLVDVVPTVKQVLRMAELNGVETHGPNGYLNFHTGLVTSTGSFDRLGPFKSHSMMKEYSKVWSTRPHDAHSSEVHRACDKDSVSGPASCDRPGAADTASSSATNGNAKKQIFAKGHQRMSRPISLRRLFESYRLPCVIDMVDIDMQGSEYWIFNHSANIALLSKRVRRVHIGLHAHSLWSSPIKALALDDHLVRQFEKYGWKREWYFPVKKGFSSRTYYGPVMFGDGVLALVNLRKKFGNCPESSHT
eukprot:TRINITY_DN5831_c0_g1_i1.p1 TRINITY_DN5831_c0_g1~~TRINITY_DN5831_c0_g1_i1.p1  ORF type:complete len:588 (+),score=58.95 TRINITY_DN5831_c0_g1_i1:24-1766(+)